MSVDFAFIDSGKGGIPYMRRLLEICPAAECVYVGDSKNFPYGEKSQQEIINLVTDLCQKIIHRFDPKAIIVACNTMSVNALDELRETFPDVKFVGTVPAIKLASSLSQRRKIGLIASNSTVHDLRPSSQEAPRSPRHQAYRDQPAFRPQRQLREDP